MLFSKDMCILIGEFRDLLIRLERVPARGEEGHFWSLPEGLECSRLHEWVGLYLFPNFKMSPHPILPHPVAPPPVPPDTSDTGILAEVTLVMEGPIIHRSYKRLVKSDCLSDTRF